MLRDVEQLCKIIEGFNKDDQIEILKIISNETTNNISENNNGTFVNMDEISIHTIKEINFYIDYVLKKNMELQSVENKKDNIKNNINDITT